MGALRRIWQGGRRRRIERGAAALALAVITAGGVAACDPAGLSSATVSFTTDQLATRELERQQADVRRLNCTAEVDGGDSASPSATQDDVATVHCEGETGDGKDITVDGRVTRAVDGACVRGDLTARIDGRQVFRVNGLGDCDAAPTPPSGQAPGPAVTVTVTQTVWCDNYPQCRPVQGK
ncbi:hypothetical protein ABZZ79_02060 [Streptomyces sp. NPDC006458]|uniref:hypothetical protein n=1 Tax=Streptomyces sp. NPDC006458 TaxID=3154302 RepID=UPI0033B66657